MIRQQQVRIGEKLVAAVLAGILGIAMPSAALAGIVGVSTPSAALADTTVAVTDIGTQVGGIATHVDSVTYSDPVIVEVPGAGQAYEMHGTVSGVGWGGRGPVARAHDAHYTYQMPYLARWPRHGGGKTLVTYHHGGGPGVIAIAQADYLQGAANVNRFAERQGDLIAGVPTLINHGTYISMNRTGLIGDGRFAAKFLTSEVAPLTQSEVDAARAAIAPGDAGYSHPDLVVGAPVPAAIAPDTATVRDVNRALQVVVAEVAGIRFREKISIGQSSGATASSGMAFGCSVIGAACVRTGGNHFVPYDATSPRIFDGFVFNGFVYNSAVERADTQQPLSGRVFFIQGRGDERYQQPIRMVYELLQKGVTLAGSVWMYEIANLTHVTRDNPLVVPPLGANGEPLGPYFSAAIRNMRELLAGEGTPPRSRIAGRIVDSGLVFDVASGTTIEMPVREDPTVDTVQVDSMLTLRYVDQGIDTGATTRWQAVTAALDHDDHDIVGPSIACRIGGYRLRFFGAALTPFAPADLAAMYGSFAGYRSCLDATVAALEAERLYDGRVESASETAERSRALFAE